MRYSDEGDGRGQFRYADICTEHIKTLPIGVYMVVHNCPSWEVAASRHAFQTGWWMADTALKSLKSEEPPE